jgi:release factor glutamine methyltransferase
VIVEGVPSTVDDAVRALTKVIAAAGVGDTPRLDAELLVGHVAELDRVGLRVHGERALEPQQWRSIDELAGRRAAGEPVAYLLGTAWFYGREFEVDRRVLVPRPETELLVQLALEHFADRAMGATFVDACTGSGCVATSIAAELGPRATVHGTDLSADALVVARANARRHGVDVTWHEGDLLEPVAGLRNVAAVVANPPYVEGIDAHGLEQGVRDHEPHIALLVPEGDTVEAFYERLARQAAVILAAGGMLAVEHGEHQQDLVRGALQRAGFVDIDGKRDLAGIERVVAGYRSGGGA